MKSNVLFVLLIILSSKGLLGQTNDLSLSNGILFPFAQESQINYDELESGLVQMRPSSYFPGLTFRKKIGRSDWAFKFSISAGEERYRLRLYNELLDLDNPDFREVHEPGLETFHQCYVTTIEGEKRIRFTNEKYQLSFFGGLFVNSSYQISFTTIFRVRYYPEIDGDNYYSRAELTMNPPKKFGLGLTGGVSVRRFLNKKNSFYIELSTQSYLRNKFEYQYDLRYDYQNLSTGAVNEFFISNGNKNRIDYSLVGVNFNLGLVW